MANDLPRSHLFYIIENRITNDKYSGLSHVAEHALLEVPTDSGKSFRAKGYTCINHVFLSFSSPDLTVLQEIDNHIMSGQVITDEIVSIAKEQVMWEIANTRNKTAISMQIQSFVTDGRIVNHAVGETDQVKKIQTSDVQDWFKQRVQSGQIYHYLFNNRDEIIDATQYIPRALFFPKLESPKQDNKTFKTLYLVSPRQVKMIRMYFRIPVLSSKLDVMGKGITEYCIQRKISSVLGLDFDIFDSFFDKNERYVLIEFALDKSKQLYGIINAILSEMDKISSEDFTLYRSEFAEWLNQLLPYDESAYQTINAIKNEIVYAYPRIERDDLCVIEQIDYDSFLRGKKMYEPVKIVFL